MSGSVGRRGAKVCVSRCLTDRRPGRKNARTVVHARIRQLRQRKHVAAHIADRRKAAKQSLFIPLGPDQQMVGVIRIQPHRHRNIGVRGVPVHVNQTRHQRAPATLNHGRAIGRGDITNRRDQVILNQHAAVRTLIIQTIEYLNISNQRLLRLAGLRVLAGGVVAGSRRGPVLKCEESRRRGCCRTEKRPATDSSR